METWPASLQDLLNVESFSYQFGDTTIRSDMDVGPAKIRSRFTRGVDKISASIDMTFDQFGVLATFYRTTLNNGVKTFGYDNPFTTTLEEFRFTEAPSIRPLGGLVFRVSLAWERMPTP